MHMSNMFSTHDIYVWNVRTHEWMNFTWFSLLICHMLNLWWKGVVTLLQCPFAFIWVLALAFFWFYVVKPRLIPLKSKGWVFNPITKLLWNLFFTSSIVLANQVGVQSTLYCLFTNLWVVLSTTLRGSTTH